MTLTWEQVTARALQALSEDERRGSAVYLDQQVLEAGDTVRVDRSDVRIRSKAAMVFVDQMPAANWGHACRYLLIDLEGGKVESIPAQFPPFLKAVPPTLRLIWKGEAVPDWAIARP